eukprot:CCRYP_018663-RE/>CCRYP_018663-RE protein AED:0.48 eAED:1.00 QI:0/0/0/1/0/0/2/0/208
MLLLLLRGRRVRVIGVYTVRLALPLRPPLLIQIALTTEAQPSTQIQRGGLIGLRVVELHRHADPRTIPRSAEPLARPLRHDDIRHGLDVHQVLRRGHDAVVDDDEALLLEPHHDLSVVHVVHGRPALVGVAVGAAQALLGVVREVLRREEERAGGRRGVARASGAVVGRHDGGGLGMGRRGRPYSRGIHVDEERREVLKEGRAQKREC